MSSKSVLQGCQIGVSSNTLLQERPRRVSYKSVLQECQVRVSNRSVPKERPTSADTLRAKECRELCDRAGEDPEYRGDMLVFLCLELRCCGSLRGRFVFCFTFLRRYVRSQERV